MAALLNELEARFYFDQFAYLLGSQAKPKTKLLKLNVGFASLLNTLTEYREQQTFVSSYAKIHFIGEAYELSDKQVRELYFVRRLLRRALNSRAFVPASEDVHFVVQTLARMVQHFADLPLPEVLAKLDVRIEQLDHSHFHAQNLQDELRATFIGKHASDEDSVIIELVADDVGQFEVLVRDIRMGKYVIPLTHNCTFLQKNQTLLLTQLEYMEGNRWATSEETLIVIEPDYLVDASAIARCFQSFGVSSAYFGLLDKLSFFEGNDKTLQGNLTNEMLDLILRKPDVTTEEAWLYALDKHKISASAFSGEKLRLLKQSVQKEFAVLLRLFVPPKAGVRMTAEPTFISPTYGIQGRLDVLTEFPEQPNRKDIIELKSRSRNPDPEKVGWRNDLIQIACYNLLLDSTYPGRRGTSALLYVQDTAHPLRNCGALNFEKQQAVLMRNRMVRLDWALSKGNEALFGHFLEQLFKQDLPNFKREKLFNFQNIWMRADALERAYFATFFGLVMREQIVAKIGGISGIEPSEGFASLWKNNVAEKREAFALLDGLQVLEFDTARMRLYLRRPEREASVTAFRSGDIVVLYPQSEGEPTGFPLLKGSLLMLSGDRVVLQLWTNYLNPTIFESKSQHWVIEPNLMEKGFQHQFAALAEFLRSEKPRRDVFLGKEKPRFAAPSTDFHPHESLSAEQNGILKQMLSAEDYFLLQGPPGTGKTSRMIRTLVHELYQKTDETIVLLAFTNRATDEICEKVAEVCGEHFIRFGQLPAEERFYERTLHALPTPEAVRERLQETRVFVSTVASFFSNFQHLRRFDTLIVDEASQLLEPHLCGIVTKFRRFILVGDEKQLPAVVTQPKPFCKTKNETLQAAGFSDLSRSVFDRLLTNAQAQGWDDCYAMLSVQFRTHETIANFFNAEFYKKLRVGSERQTSNWDWFDPKADNPDERLLAQNRMLFLPTEAENETKFNRREAEQVVRLVGCIAERLGEQNHFSEQSVGVITPYRAQIAEIRRRLPARLREQVTVDTVERYQGSERDIILLSMAINHPALLQNVQSFDAGQRVDRKLNVALSRAREQLILLGNEAILRKGIFYDKLIRYIRSQSS